VFDVNDFDEAYVGHFSWDLRRFVASLTLMGWQKALPQDAVRDLARTYLDAYVDQVRHYHQADSDTEYALRLDNTKGALYDVLQGARGSSRIRMLDKLSVVENNERHFREGGGNRVLKTMERNRVMKAFDRYLETIPSAKREAHGEFYNVKDVVGKSGFGIGSAGLPAYSFIIEGYNQALENDIVLTMKQANVPAVSRYADLPAVTDYFEHEGHRTAVSQRALQVHADPFLGWTEVGEVGYVVDELSPYETDLDWSEINEPDDIQPVVEALGRATAKIHCVSDEDSEQSLVEFQTEEASRASSARTPASSSTTWSSSASPTPTGCARTMRCSSTRSAAAASAGSPPPAAESDRRGCHRRDVVGTQPSRSAADWPPRRTGVCVKAAASPLADMFA
jgi:uncharacterized protein (DUF2252 family)